MRMSSRMAWLVLACCAVAQTAAAAIVSGSFAGTAHDALMFPSGPVTPRFEGASVQGTFRIDTSLLGAQSLPDPAFATYRLTADALLLTFSLLGQTYRFGDQGLESFASVFTGQGGQVVTLAANVNSASYPTAMLTFGNELPTGALGLYVDGLDLTSLRPVPGLPSFTYVAFQLTQDLGAEVLLTQWRFDGVAQVPEPATWALLLSGLALAWRQRSQAVRKPR